MITVVSVVYDGFTDNIHHVKIV